MITWTVWKSASNVGGAEKLERLYYGEGYCLSTDEKPTEGIASGSTCIVTDTREVFFFDGETRQWI